MSQPKQESFSQTDLDNCATAACPEISVDYISYPKQKDCEATLNKVITDFIITSLYLEDPDQAPTAVTIEEAAASFIESYWQDHAEFPDLAAAYFAEIFVTESYRRESLLSLEMSQYKYTGGAHGYGTIAFSNFDLKTGTKITNKNLFSDYEGFAGFAEMQFRKAYHISEESNINADRFWFENDTFMSLPVLVLDKTVWFCIITNMKLQAMRMDLLK